MRGKRLQEKNYSTGSCEFPEVPAGVVPAVVVVKLKLYALVVVERNVEPFAAAVVAVPFVKVPLLGVVSAVVVASVDVNVVAPLVAVVVIAVAVVADVVVAVVVSDVNTSGKANKMIIRIILALF